MTPALAVNNSFVSKRWPQPEYWAPIVRGLGVSSVQFSFDVLDPVLTGAPGDYEHARQICDAQALSITSAFTGTIAYTQPLLGDPRAHARARAEEWYRHAIKAAARLGARAFGGHVGTMSLHQYAAAAERRRGAAREREAMLRLTRVANRERLECLLWEPQPVWREYPAGMEQVADFVARWADAGDVPIRLCLDLGHACLPGSSGRERDPYAWLEDFGAQARVIHLQQTDGVLDRHWAFVAEHNERGIIEPRRVVEILARVAQSDIELAFEVSVRHDMQEDAVLKQLSASVAHWKSAFAALVESVGVGTEMTPEGT